MLQLTSKRLSLRSVQPEDAAALFAYRKEKAVSQYLSLMPEKVSDLTRFIQEKNCPRVNETGTWHQLVVMERQSGQLIGDIGLHFLEADTVEIGYTFSPLWQGKGFAGEAVAAIITYLSSQLNKHKIIANVDPENSPSIRLLERLGFRFVAHYKQHVQVQGHWVDHLEYHLLLDKATDQAQ